MISIKDIKDLKFELYLIRRCYKNHKLKEYISKRFILAKNIYSRNLATLIRDKSVNENLSIHILVGHSGVILLFWSLASFYLFAEEAGELYVHNDGTLTRKDKILIKKNFYHCRIVEPSEVFNSQKSKLKNFNIIYNYRRSKLAYVHSRKIIDTFFLSKKEYILVFDTDVLWFNNPHSIVRYIRNNSKISLLMQRKEAKRPIYFKNGGCLDGEGYNSGIVFYKRQNLDLNKLSEFITKVDFSHKTSYFFEQSAFIYSLKNLFPFPPDKYLLKGKIDSGSIAKHYTGPKREQYFLEGINFLKDKILI